VYAGVWRLASGAVAGENGAAANASKKDAL